MKLLVRHKTMVAGCVLYNLQGEKLKKNSRINLFDPHMPSLLEYMDWFQKYYVVNPLDSS